MKNLVKEVVFPAYGDWKIEAYAWCKELARRLNAKFRVLQNNEATDQADEFAHKILRGDGYYFGHYNYSPTKTHLTSQHNTISPEFLSFLTDSSGLAVLVLDTKAKPALEDESINLSHHLVLSLPNPLEITSRDSEFLHILRQITILNLPFDYGETDKQSWLTKLLNSLRTFVL